MISNLQMEYLLAVARTGNITKAAELLHISQPSLSNQIIALEKELGIPLLERRHKRVYLTDAGRYFATQSQKIILQTRNLEHTMNEFSTLKKGTLRVGLLPILCPLYLPEMIALFQKNYSNVQLILTVDGSKNLLRQLKDENLDVIIAILEKGTLQKEITAVPLRHSMIEAAVHENHPLAKLDIIEIHKLLDESLIISGDSFVLQHIVQQNMEAQQIPLTYSHKCSQIESCLALVDKGIGISFCSPEVAAYYHFPHVVLRPLEPPITRDIYLIYKKQPAYLPLLQAFVQHVRTEFNIS